MSHPPYPQEWETDALLSDGSTVRIRPIRPDDRRMLIDFHGRQTPESIYFRYFSPHPRLSERELEHLTNIDYRTRMAFVAVVAERLVGVARYEGRTKDPSVELADVPVSGEMEAEVAFFVDGDFQGRGLGTLLLEYLAAAGRHHRVRGFVASVLPENYGMLRVFRRAGFDVKTSFEEGVIQVQLGIDVTPAASAAIEARERVAQAKSVARMLEPSSVAVIGAGRHPDSVGHRLAFSLVSADFAGRVQVVSRHASEIAGVSTVSSVAELTAPVDLAVICLPAADVLAAVEQCIALGVAGLLVISGGFADVGIEGALEQRRLVELVRGNGLRLIGPNAFGVANTDPDLRLRALFLPVSVPVGEVGLLSQSGPLGAALLAVFERAGTGVSSFAALGNRADVSVNDLLQYWAFDPRTSVIGLYLENLGNFGKFTRLAQVISRTKPIVAVAPLDADRSELVRQSGVVLVSEVSELAAQARVAVTQAVPNGRRVVIVSNASSVARLCVAACRSAGLDVVVPGDSSSTPVVLDDLEAEAIDWVRVGDTERAAVTPPAAPLDYERTVVAAAVSSDVDSVLVALVPTPGLAMEDVAILLDRIDDAVAKPMVVVGLSGVSPRSFPRLPVFDFPEQAAKALARWSDYGVWRGTDRGRSLELEQPAAVAAELDRLTVGHPAAARLLEREPAERLLGLCGVDLAPSRAVLDATSAAIAAEELGYPVALKAGDGSRRLAGEAGGVALDLRGPDQVRSAFGRMADLVDGFLPAIVQPMMPTGHHVAIEVRQDVDGGSRLALAVRGDGIASTTSRKLLLLPATSQEVEALVDTVAFSGTGITAQGRHALRRTVANLAAAVASFPSLVRIDVNPVLVSEQRAVAVDVVVEVQRFERDPLAEVRHLSAGS